MPAHREGLLGTSTLTEQQAQEVNQLADVCEAADGLDLKLTINTGASHTGAVAAAFRWFAHGELVGFCALDYHAGSEAELCGMVRPDYRRRGTGRALLTAATAACAQLGITSLLLICEDASASGQAFVATLGARRVSTELHMERGPSVSAAAVAPAPRDRLALRPATAADTGALAHILVEGFGGGEDSVHQRVALGIDDPHGPYLLGLLADTPIGAMKLYHTGAKTGIYAFSVLPRYQGQGYGRWMLSQALADLRAQGHTRTMLEVDPDNAPAIVLYRSCGFTLTTTYGYYALAVEPLAPVSP